jgi:Uma2 family endonuclease
VYEAYYNPVALEMMYWAHEENNRIKAANIANVAQKLEDRYRKAYPSDGYTRPSAMIPVPIRPMSRYTSPAALRPSGTHRKG